MLGSLVAVPMSFAGWADGLDRHPELDVKLDLILPSAQGQAHHIISLRGPDAERAHQALSERLDGQRVQLIYREGGRLQVRVAVADCPVADALWRTALVPSFPAPVVDAEAHLFVVAQEEPLDGFLERLNRAGVEARLMRRAAAVDGVQDLTNYQYDILRRALAEGYYDRPRRATLTEIAQRVGVAKSTLSETLRAVERKVVHRRVHGRFPPGTLKRASPREPLRTRTSSVQ